MKWEEIVAEARAAGILAFCSEGIAVLKRRDDAEKPPVRPGPTESSPQSPSQAGGQGGQSGAGEGESSQ
jgi:hypothetical protein